MISYTPLFVVILRNGFWKVISNDKLENILWIADIQDYSISKNQKMKWPHLTDRRVFQPRKNNIL